MALLGDVIRLCGRIMAIPLAGASHSVDRLADAMHEMQRLAEDGILRNTGKEYKPEQAVTAPRAALTEWTPPVAAPVSPPVAAPPPVRTVLGAGSNSVEKKERHMDKDLRDDMLKLVKYRVLFVKREYEASFGENEEVVEDNMDGAALTAWKTAEFAQQLTNNGVRMPTKWANTYPPAPFRDQPAAGMFNGLPDDDKKYLRVSYEVLERYPRERFKYEEQQIKILDQIREKLP